MSNNLYIWANENLSTARARSFTEKLRQIDNSKFSAEWQQARQILDSLERSHVMNNREEIQAVQDEAQKKTDAIKEQIKELQNQIEEIDAEMVAKTTAIRCAIYRDNTYLTQEEICTALWHRDDQAVQAQRDALVAKYQAAQEKAGA
jgi:butyrate kinase